MIPAVHPPVQLSSRPSTTYQVLLTKKQVLDQVPLIKYYLLKSKFYAIELAKSSETKISWT